MFVAIGGTIIFLAIKSEPNPVVIGNNNAVEVNSLVDIEKEEEKTSNVDVSSIEYEVTDNILKDTSNTKIKSNMTLPIVSVNGENLSDINTQIQENYEKLFSALQETLSSAENKFTYRVTYKTYDNTIGQNRILSITIFQRVTDDSAKKNTTEKVNTYNINLATKQIVKIDEIAVDIFGNDWKSIVNDGIKNYVVGKKMTTDSKYTYTLTGLENCYIKDSTFHLIFNEGELVDKKYSVLDIEINANK